MALRIGGGKLPVAPPIEEALAGTEEEMPVEETSEPMPDELMSQEPEPEIEQPAQSGGVVDPMIAGYRGPDQGPFICGNCQHYGAAGEGTCAIVSGQIDEAGICNMFTTLGQLEESGMEEEMPVEEELPTEDVPAGDEIDVAAEEQV